MMDEKVINEWGGPTRDEMWPISQRGYVIKKAHEYRGVQMRDKGLVLLDEQLAKVRAMPEAPDTEYMVSLIELWKRQLVDRAEKPSPYRRASAA